MLPEAEHLRRTPKEATEEAVRRGASPSDLSSAFQGDGKLKLNDITCRVHVYPDDTLRRLNIPFSGVRGWGLVDVRLLPLNRPSKFAPPPHPTQGKGSAYHHSLHLS